MRDHYQLDEDILNPSGTKFDTYASLIICPSSPIQFAVIQTNTCFGYLEVLEYWDHHIAGLHLRHNLGISKMSTTVGRNVW